MGRREKQKDREEGSRKELIVRKDEEKGEENRKEKIRKKRAKEKRGK